MSATASCSLGHEWPCAAPTEAAPYPTGACPECFRSPRWVAWDEGGRRFIADIEVRAASDRIDRLQGAVRAKYPHLSRWAVSHFGEFAVKDYVRAFPLSDEVARDTFRGDAVEIAAFNGRGEELVAAGFIVAVPGGGGVHALSDLGCEVAWAARGQNA